MCSFCLGAVFQGRELTQATQSPSNLLIVYKISCKVCRHWNYIAETGRRLQTEEKERIKNNKNCHKESNISYHPWTNNHPIDFENASVVDKGDHRLRKTVGPWHTATTNGVDSNSMPLPRQNLILLK